MTTAALTPRAVAIAAVLKQTREKIRDLEAAADTMQAAIIVELIQAGADTGDDDTGTHIVRWQPVRKFDPKAAAGCLTAAQIAECTTIIDTKAVKALLTGEQLDTCMVESGNRRFTLA